MNRTNIYLTQKQIEFLKSIKKDRGTNASETIRQLINKKMEEVDGRLQGRAVQESERD